MRKRYRAGRSKPGSRLPANARKSKKPVRPSVGAAPDSRTTGPAPGCRYARAIPSGLPGPVVSGTKESPASKAPEGSVVGLSSLPCRPCIFTFIHLKTALRAWNLDCSLQPDVRRGSPHPQFAIARFHDPGTLFRIVISQVLEGQFERNPFLLPFFQVDALEALELLLGPRHRRPGEPDVELDDLVPIPLAGILHHRTDGHLAARPGGRLDPQAAVTEAGIAQTVPEGKQGDFPQIHVSPALGDVVVVERGKLFQGPVKSHRQAPPRIVVPE